MTLDETALDDVAVQDVRPADLVPGQRTAAHAAVAGEVEPKSSRRATRPLSEYWDVESARWTSRAPVPGPRQGD
jgi:hypothetical protein